MALFILLILLAGRWFDLSKAQALIDQHQDLAYLLSLGVIFFAFLTLLPTIPLPLFIAALIGPLPAALLTGLGTSLAALVHYQIGKQLGDVLDFEAKKHRLPFHLGRLPVSSPLFLLLGRLFPGAPTGLNFVCGAYAVPHFLFLWTTCLTNFLGAAFVSFGGYELIRL
jgi:uncharacterized membrane protein YdjX (TVP38/TMEM64 family)